MIFNPDAGIIGYLQVFGFHVSDPLSRPSTSLYAVASVDLWHWWGFLCVIFFAAFRQVDVSQIEAARLDGARYFQLMRYVLLPAIRPTIVLMMIMTVIWSFLAFDFVYILTQGGPAYSSEVLSTLSYRYAFYNFTMGPAAAAALVIALFGIVATVFYVRVQQREVQA
jgi:raffinose/stachyose/melibiose transport system permease protein